MNKTYLGIETSCDDTAVALLNSSAILHQRFVQQQSHCDYGGIVPEVASRDHAGKLLTLVKSVLDGEKPDVIACTAGPGLSGCLATGVSLAQSLAYSWQIPLAPVNHLEGHLLSPFLEFDSGFEFPYLCLLVSGGHTCLVDVKASKQYKMIATTLDDAAGEAFDKTGILLGLDFPGGALLEKLAEKGNAQECPISEAMQKRKDLAFSFSGLKTAARNLVAKGHNKNDIAASFQEAAIKMLITKTKKALQMTGRTRIAAVGGVASNFALRASLETACEQFGASLHFPPLKWCTDNAAMIAYAGQHRIQQGYEVKIRPRWSLEDL